MLEFKNYLKEVKKEYTQFELNQIKESFSREKQEYLIAEQSFNNEKKRFEQIKEKFLKEKNKFEDIVENAKII